MGHDAMTKQHQRQVAMRLLLQYLKGDTAFLKEDSFGSRTFVCFLAQEKMMPDLARISGNDSFHPRIRSLAEAGLEPLPFKKHKQEPDRLN